LLYEYTLPWTEFDLTTLVVIGTDCTGNYDGMKNENFQSIDNRNINLDRTENKTLLIVICNT
jgi:hypothetical protein